MGPPWHRRHQRAPIRHLGPNDGRPIMKTHHAKSSRQRAEQGTPMSPVHRQLTPDSRLLTPAARTGISLMEVLVSIGIVAIGLVSVLSLLPVGGYQAARA